jgi:hypothetical protein
MEPIRLQAAPEGGSADAKGSGRLRELPIVHIQSLHDSLFFPGRQRSRPRDPGNEHRLPQFEPAYPKWTEPSPQCSQPGLQIGGPL